MATPKKKKMTDREAGEAMLNEVFTTVEQLNAAAGPAMAEKGIRTGNMTFSPKIIIDEENNKQYTCDVDIYTPKSADIGPQINMELSGNTIEQFKSALKTVQVALAGLAAQGYLSDTFTVGLLKPASEEIEIYAPDVLKPGMYSINEA